MGIYDDRRDIAATVAEPEIVERKSAIWEGLRQLDPAIADLAHEITELRGKLDTVLVSGVFDNTRPEEPDLDSSGMSTAAVTIRQTLFQLRMLTLDLAAIRGGIDL